MDTCQHAGCQEPATGEVMVYLPESEPWAPDATTAVGPEYRTQQVRLCTEHLAMCRDRGASYSL